MLLTYLISISLVFGVIYAGEISNDQYLTQFDDNILHEGSPFFDKIKAILSVMKSEIDRKLEALEKHIPENLEETINRKIYALEHKIPDRLEEYFDGKFHKLEKKLLDKLEEYMDEKIDLMEKKLNVLEKTIPKDMDSKINNMGVFIDILMKNIPDFDKKINWQLNTLTNNTDKNINHKDDTNHQSDEIDTKIPYICNDTVINCKRDVLNNKTPDLAELLSRKLDSLKKMIPNLEGNVSRKLEELDKKILEKLEKDINCQLYIMEKIKIPEIELKNNITTIHDMLELMNQKLVQTVQIIDHKLDIMKSMIPIFEGNISRQLVILNEKIPEKFEENVNHQLNIMEKIIMPGLNENITIMRNLLESMPQKIEQTIGHRLDATQKTYDKHTYDGEYDLKFFFTKFDSLLKYLHDKKIDKINRSPGLRCKERVARGYNYKPLYRIDNETLNNVPLKRNKAGNITYFEMHIAIKAAKDGLILLSPVPEPSTSDRVFEICVGIANNQQTDLRLNLLTNSVGNTNTPDILTPTYYESFYIKIANGKLEFGKENSNTPLISYKDELLNSVKYFGFGSWDNHEAKYLYDCPL